MWQTRPSAATKAEGFVAIAELQTPIIESLPSQTQAPIIAQPAVQATELKRYELNDWPQLEQAIQDCHNCELAKSCNRKVPGKGSKQADLMIIGEAPGHDEDLQGIPFVGRAGQLLNKILLAIQLDPESVYITNILKCRPPNNRDPHTDEVQACSQFLDAQIKLIQPKVILSVGRISAQNLLKDHSPLGKLRTKNHLLPGKNLPMLVTYHPAYLLRNPAEKAKVWHDMKALHKLLNDAQSHAEH